MSPGAFAQLSARVQALLHDAGLDEPTAAQEHGIPPILAGEDVLVIAPTGSGKTEAALLPVLSALAERKKVGIGALYITPLRALNRDMERRIQAWAAKLDLRVEVRHGDTPTNTRRKQALKPPDLLITTPETLQAILPASRMREHLASVKWVVIDEVHQLAKDRRGVQLCAGMERLAEVATFQRIALSATVGEPEQVAAMFGGKKPLRVVKAAPPKLMEFQVEWPKPNDGDFDIARELFISPEIASYMTLMRDLIDSHEATLVFVNSRLNAELLGSRFPTFTEGVGVHHGSLPREAREKAEGDYKAGKLRALVATSTLELGIDVGRVDLAIQYQSPRQATSLVQRVGRAGHDLKRVSKGSIVAVSADDVLESVAVIQRAKQGLLEPPKLHKGALDVLAHQIVGLAMDHEGRIARQDALNILQRAEPFRDVTREQLDKVADFLVQLRHVRADGEDIVTGRNTRDYYFRNLSTIEDERTYPVIDLSTMRPVGILGEEEVVLRARAGYRFVVRGRTWRIVQVGHDGLIYVEPYEDPTARIPGWQGEVLPVPWEVARTTVQVRSLVGECVRAKGADPAVEEFAKEWPVAKGTVRRVVNLMEEQFASGAPFPGANDVVIEGFDHFLVVHSPFGEIVNETFGDLLEELLARKGMVRFYWTDAYRILIELTVPVAELDLPSLARELLVQSEAQVEELLKVFLDDHYPLGYKMKGVAERFGAIPRGLFIPADDLNSFEVRFANTPVETEAMREVLLCHVDFEHVREVFTGLRDGSLRIQTWQGEQASPMAYPVVR
ncbi:MAG: DEAD/DEAH box helicase, partial [Halobacteriales archaeon]|nr:DEAD/DEAH box helicase [Halobacteriales archaeon]